MPGLPGTSLPVTCSSFGKLLADLVFQQASILMNVSKDFTKRNYLQTLLWKQYAPKQKSFL